MFAQTAKAPRRRIAAAGDRGLEPEGEKSMFTHKNAARGGGTLTAMLALYFPAHATGQVDAAPTTAASEQLQEVVVTAEKKTERLQDVPIPVSVVDAQELLSNNEVKLTDYYSQVPGLSVAPSVLSTQTVTIRGISTGAIETGPPGAAPTVGIVVDDVPFGGSSGADTFVPDFDPGDLQRIEVLRGPQGSLYGASSMGGLIKFVTLDPSTDSLSGRVEAGTDSVYNGAELGYNYRGSLNVPLTDDFAIRASAFARQDPGYIDNPVLGVNGVNEDHGSGGHLVALWRPSDAVSVKLNALYQVIDGDGTSDVTPNPPPGVGAPPMLGDLQQFYIRGVGPYDRIAEAYSAVVNYKVGSVDLTSLTGFNRYRFHDELDATASLGPFSEQTFGEIGSPTFDLVDVSRFTQELRLASPLGQHFDLLLGMFYSHEVESFDQFFDASNPNTGALVGHWFTAAVPNTLGELAGFGDLTWHLTDRFDMQFGARESQFEIVNKSAIWSGPLNTLLLGLPSENHFIPGESSDPNAFTYLFTPRFKISPDLMVYVRLASGYRAGGNNFGIPDVPTQFSPDKTENYELGSKGDFFEHRLSIDASLYYIDWKNLQVPLVTPPPVILGYTGNAAAAKSEGVELSVDAQPISSLTVAAWVDIANAELTQNVPGAGENGVIYAFAGDKLPYAARFTGNLSAQQDFPLAGAWTGFVGGMVSYVGAREDVFPVASPERQYLPPYAKTDLRLGAKAQAWTVNLYMNNVTDRRGLISGGIGNVVPYSYYYIQPRIVGVNIARQF
jgi:iron complex outermembrane recepter protein